MSNDGKFIADTLESIIVGMAESLTEAQEELSSTAPVDSFGRPMPQYRIPHLDFEVKFDLATETKGPGSGMMIRFLRNTETTKDVSSTISGRFVAVPPGDGMPLPVITLALEGTGNERDLVVTVANSAGELLEGASVELNIDQDASSALTGAAARGTIRFDTQVQFGSAVLTSGPDGTARTTSDFWRDIATRGHCCSDRRTGR